jgi:hypothetical protein
MKVFRKLLAATAGIAIGLTGGLMFASPASAVTSGCGSACDGKDPQTYYASVDGGSARCFYDAVTIYVAHGAELRYSPYCRTAWARSEDPGYLGFVTVESYNSSGRRKVYSTRNASRSYTLMVNDKGMSARACHYGWPSEVEYNRGDAPGLDGCTAKY